MAHEFSPEVKKLLAEPRLPELGHGHSDESRRADLERLDPLAISSSGEVVDQEMARACLAGLWLHFDFLDEAHRISQEIGSPEGSYWHGVMHRREGDFANASYWFRRAGTLPFFAKLGQAGSQLLQGQPEHPQLARLAKGDVWDPYRFVDICKACVGGLPAIEEPCRRLQLLEWQNLFEHTFEQAMLGNSRGPPA